MSGKKIFLFYNGIVQVKEGEQNVKKKKRLIKLGILGLILLGMGITPLCTLAAETVQTTEATTQAIEGSLTSSSKELISSREQESASTMSSDEITNNSAEKFKNQKKLTLEKQQYVIIKNEKAVIYKNIEFKEIIPLSDIEETILVTEEKVSFEGDNYFVLTNLEKKIIAVVKEVDVDLFDTPYSQKKVLNKYVSLKTANPYIYKDLELNSAEKNNLIKGQTFLAEEVFSHINGDQFYSLVDSKGALVGYISVTNVTVAESKGGVYQTFEKYATVKSNNSNTVSDFNGKVKYQTKEMHQQTYFARGRYHHFDGSYYYSIFDNKNKWMGYINEKSVSITDGKQGAYQPLNSYTVVKSKNYSIWQNFSWQKKYNSSQFFNRTFIAKGEYHHFNGDVYYSLYDQNDKWYGYINKTGTSLTKDAQGPYVSYGKYVTIKKSSGNSWSNFGWTKRQDLKNLSGTTFLAKGIYYHANGNDYVSIYDQNNKWYGYVNKNFVSVGEGKQGAYQGYGKYVTITKQNYSLWRNFSWNKLGSSNNIYHKTLYAKGKYKHFNGETYYSLFDKNNKWYGYINAKGSSVADGPQGVYQSYGQRVTISKKNYSMWSDFNWKQRHNTTSFINKQFTARGKYQHFNGSTYLSLYGDNNKWYGYLNESATSRDAEKLAKVQKLLNSKYSSPNLGIYVTSLADGSSASVNGNKIFTAASTGKLPAMYYTQKMINQKKLDPNKKYMYTDAINQMPVYSYMRGGAGILQGKPYGSYYSLDTMLNWTAKYSDNQGANFLGYYGANQYDAKMRNEISSIIGRTWYSPFQVSAKENAMLISAMYRQGGQVMRYMQNTVFDNQRIARDLPVPVAHKIGDVGSYCHDVAVVYTDSPYVLSIMTQNGTSYDTISRISNDVYNIMK